MKRLVIFDLDGTLLDTIADLGFAVNYALQVHGYPPHSPEAYPRMVGNGVLKLLERALPEAERSPERALSLCPAFRDFYEAHLTDHSRPYPGVEPLLERLQAAGFRLAVASNKYQQATESLVAACFPAGRFDAVLGQREGVPVKPDPAIVFDILKRTGVSAPDALYVGDSGVDMTTAFRSGVDSVGVTWGFRSREELVAAGAGRLADTPDAIWEAAAVAAG